MKSIRDAAINLDECIKCGICSAHCPVAAVNPNYPGPKSAGPDAERLRLEGVWFDPACLNYCSNCKTCEVVCPSGVKITDMILKARGKGPQSPLAGIYYSGFEPQGARAGLRTRLRDTVLARAEYVGKIATICPQPVNGLLKIKGIRSLMEKLTGIGRYAAFPAYQKKLTLKKSSPAGIKAGKKQVVYFPGCFATYNDPAIARSTIGVLEHNGYEVLVPEFCCCGVPLEANGHFRGAENNGLRNLRLLHPYLEAGLPVVTSCTSCGLALKEEYPRLEEPGASRIGRQTYDLFEFLWQLHEQGQLREDFQPLPVSLGYHAPCHLKAQGVGTPSVRVLRLIPGISVETMDSGCCGLSGSYGFKEEKYEFGQQIGRALFERILLGQKRQEFKEVTTECGVCQVQIARNTGADTLHPVSLLARAYQLKAAQ